MTTDINELVKRLKRTVYRSDWDDTIVYANPDGLAAADALEAMAGEVEKWKQQYFTASAQAIREAEKAEAAEAERDRLAGEAETAKSQFKALQMVTSKEHEDTRAERDRLKAALSKKLSAKARQKLGDFSESMIAMGDGRSLEMLLNWYDESRKALGGDA